MDIPALFPKFAQRSFVFIDIPALFLHFFSTRTGQALPPPAAAVGRVAFPFVEPEAIEASQRHGNSRRRA